MWAYLQANGTKVLGYIIAALGVVQSSVGVVPPSWMPYITTVVGILVVLRGQGNTQAIADAVVQKHLDNLAQAQGVKPTEAPK